MRQRIHIGLTALLAFVTMGFTILSRVDLSIKGLMKSDLLDGCYTFVKAYCHTGTPPSLLTFTNTPIYMDYITIYTFSENFPIALKTNYTLLSVSGAYGQIAEPDTECPYLPNPPVCCYLVEYSKVVAIKFGLYDDSQ